MVRLPIRFPSWWPSLRVTSYLRSEGSHSTGQAIDISIDWKGSKAKDSDYWFYYFVTYDSLMRAQRSGITRVCIPYACPHYHIEYNTGVNRVGWELIQPVYRSKTQSWECVYDSHDDASKNDSTAYNNMVKYLRNKIFKLDEIPLSRWVKLSLATLKDFSDAYLPVNNPTAGLTNGIDDATLQQWLDNQYTDSTATQIADGLTQIVSQKPNIQKAAEDTANAIFKWAAIGAAGYFAFKYLETKTQEQARRSVQKT